MNTYAALEELTRAYYELQFRNRFREAVGNAFQDFFSTVMEMRYPGDFVRVRPWGKLGDRKNDGYLRSKRKLFQCFGPQDMKPMGKCLRKINEDFADALPYWNDYFDEWIFTHNDIKGLPAEILRLLLDLSKRHHPVRAHQWGYTELLVEFKALSEADVVTLLGGAPGLKDVVSVGVKDVSQLLHHIALQPETFPADVRPVPAEKIEYNQLSPFVSTLLLAGMTRADVVKKYLRGIADQTRYDRIASAFRSRYEDLKREGLPPDDIFAGLQQFITGPGIQSCATQAAALAILAFFFEACEIFRAAVERELMQVILPTKGLAVDRALLSVGGEILRRLRRPKTVSRLWEEIRRRHRGLTESVSYDWFLLALNLLYIWGVVELYEGRVRRTRRGSQQ